MTEVLYFLPGMFFLWGIDTFIIYQKKLNILYVGDALYIDNCKTKAEDILSINPLSISLGSWNIDALRFTVKNDQVIRNYKGLLKTNTFIRYIKKKKSPTYDLLYKYFPELKNKTGGTIFEFK